MVCKGVVLEKSFGQKMGRAWAAVWFAIVCGFAGTASADASAGALIRADLDRFIRARMPEASVTIEVPPLTSFVVDRSRFPGPLRTELSTRAKEPLRGRVPVAVALYAGDHLVKRSVVTPYVRVSERVVVPTRNVPSGTTLSAADLKSVERDAARIPKDAIRDLDSAIGLQARRSLVKGQPFRASKVQNVPIVERGDRVQIILTTGALVIQSAGKAQQTGALGEWIRVLNVDSKRELSGRVDAEGRVHVAF